MNLLHATVLLIVYMFIVAVCYVVLSRPATNVLDAVNNSTTVTQVHWFRSYLGGVMDLGFAIACLIPIAWFIFWVYHREPDWRQ